MYRSWISGIGSFLPEKKLTNSDIEKLVDTTSEWILERTGIESRRIAEPGVGPSDLAFAAAQDALKMANITAQDLDMIVFATVSPDYIMPSAACELQRKLGARNIMAFDVSAACSGFLYATNIADQFIRSGQYKHVLVVGAEVLHNMVDYTDRGTCILFGDGAGVAVVSRVENPDQQSYILSSHMHAEGNIGDLFVLTGGGSKIPLTKEALDQKLNFVQMKGREIFKHAVRTMALACQEALDANGMTKEQVKWVIPHQANIRIIEAVAKHFDISMDNVAVSIQEMGNTSAATVPVTLAKYVKEGKIVRGDVVLLTAFGAGITSGSILLKY
jgi:3-oxoacyl-[acyl-carrier-protein] synthase III